MAGRLTFDPDTHAYCWHEGPLRRPLVSVTQALVELGIYDPSRYPPGAGARGTAAHQRTADMDRDDWLLPDFPVTDDVTEAYQRFRAAYRPAWTLIEQPLADPVRGFAGTPDRYGVMQGFADGRPGVLDLKSGALAPWHPLQVAAYAHLLRVNDYPVAWGALLYLRTGRVIAVPLDDLVPKALTLIGAVHIKRAFQPRRTVHVHRHRPQPPDFDPDDRQSPRMGDDPDRPV